MNTEQKAKAYDEALEKTKGLLDSPRTCFDINQLKDIFPQLKESDDERVRKSLIEFLTIIKGISESERTTWTVRKGDAEMCKSSIAYLEKQKENNEKEYVFRPLAGTDINSAVLQAIRRADEGDRLVLAFNGAYIPVRKGVNANKIVEIYDGIIEKQNEVSKAIEVVERIDKYIDENLANAHDMKDSNPDKKYYRGWDDALGAMAGILQDVYSGEKQKEQKPSDLSEMMVHKEPYIAPVPTPMVADEQKPDTRDVDDLQLLGFIYDLLNEIKWKDNWAMSKDECLRRLNNYRPQKPAGWSQSDALMCNAALGLLRSHPNLMAPYGINKSSIIRWLQAFRPQKRGFIDDICSKAGISIPYLDGNQWCILKGDNIQSGVVGFGGTKEDALVNFIKDVPILQELSEFDKGVLKDAICATDILGNDESFNKGNPNLAKTFRIAKDRLKTLPLRCPKSSDNWKPSEEQMEALHTAMYLEEMQFYGGLKDKLRDLYVQLKKL